jgi:hypothetical protein
MSLEQYIPTRDQAIDRLFKSKSCGTRWHVYEYRRDRSLHISVDPNNKWNFHATVGNYRYGYDYYGNERKLKSTGYYNNNDIWLARQLFFLFRNFE